MEKKVRVNKNYVHHQDSRIADVLKEVIFGIEDGMVSTLGSITGIAIGSGSHSLVILAGVVIISVEAISMGIGSYVSNISEEEMNKRMIEEEEEELRDFPEEEKIELREIYREEGWPEDLAVAMSEAAAQNKKLMLREMIVHELNIPKDHESVSVKGGIFMFFSYILGGLVPLISYLLLPLQDAIPFSILITLAGLFILGMGTTKFTRQPLIKSGLRILIMGGIALGVGLAAGIFMRV